MARPTTKGGTTFGPKTVVAFLVGVGVGLVLVAPVLPETLGPLAVDVLQDEGTVIVTGVSALAILMVLMAVLYQGYLKA